MIRSNQPNVHRIKDELHLCLVGNAWNGHSVGTGNEHRMVHSWSVIPISQNVLAPCEKRRCLQRKSQSQNWFVSNENRKSIWKQKPELPAITLQHASTPRRGWPRILPPKMRQKSSSFTHIDGPPQQLELMEWFNNAHVQTCVWFKSCTMSE